MRRKTRGRWVAPIKCVKIGKWKFCLECGFFYGRIVVTRRYQVTM